MQCQKCGNDVACPHTHGGGKSGCGCLWGIGTGIAGTLSWFRWHSVMWAILHGIASWLYLLYRWFFA